VGRTQLTRSAFKGEAPVGLCLSISCVNCVSNVIGVEPDPDFDVDTFFRVKSITLSIYTIKIGTRCLPLKATSNSGWDWAVREIVFASAGCRPSASLSCSISMHLRRMAFILICPTGSSRPKDSPDRLKTGI
jgi:hypothetical protein